MLCTISVWYFTTQQINAEFTQQSNCRIINIRLLAVFNIIINLDSIHQPFPDILNKNHYLTQKKIIYT